MKMNVGKIADDIRITRMHKTMIGYAEQKGSTVYVNGPNVGYIWHRVEAMLSHTPNTVTIKHGSTTYMWRTQRS